jgi:hypothetical protein
MGQFIQVSSQTRKASSVITQVKNLQDEEDKDNQARYLIAAKRHQYYDDANTPKRQNRGTRQRHKRSKYILDEANDDEDDDDDDDEDDDDDDEGDNDDRRYHHGACADEANNGEGYHADHLSLSIDVGSVLGSGIGDSDCWDNALGFSGDVVPAGNQEFIAECQPIFHEMRERGIPTQGTIPRVIQCSDHGAGETFPMAEGEEKSY